MSGASRSAVDLLREALAYVDAWLDYRVWKLRTPGAQVAVWFDGALQFSKAYGVANIDTREPLTTAHLFRIASHSKTFTATAIMQLVEAGKLRLDDTAGSWLPALAEAGSPLADATVRHLLAHSAGVRRDGVDATYWALNRPFPDEAALLELALREGDVRQPDATFKYTNIGYSLLGLIVGKAAGSTYAEYVQTAIIGKLGLRNTGPELDEARRSDYAGGHSGLGSWTERQVIPHVDTRAMAAATGFYSTAEEMVRFASAHFFGDDRLLSDRSKNEMQRPVWVGLSPERAAGWVRVWHDRAALRRAPDGRPLGRVSGPHHPHDVGPARRARDRRADQRDRWAGRGTRGRHREAARQGARSGAESAAQLRPRQQRGHYPPPRRPTRRSISAVSPVASPGSGG